MKNSISRGKRESTRRSEFVGGERAPHPEAQSRSRPICSSERAGGLLLPLRHLHSDFGRRIEISESAEAGRLREFPDLSRKSATAQAERRRDGLAMDRC